jgi:hypothetical protein
MTCYFLLRAIAADLLEAGDDRGGFGNFAPDFWSVFTSKDGMGWDGMGWDGMLL